MYVILFFNSSWNVFRANVTVKLFFSSSSEEAAFQSAELKQTPCFMEGAQRRLWQLSAFLQKYTRYGGFFCCFFFTVQSHAQYTHAFIHLCQIEVELNFKNLEEGSHYNLDFLSVRKDYVIYFLSKLLWRDYTLERYGGLRICPAPQPSLRQGRVSAAYVQPVSRFGKRDW